MYGTEEENDGLFPGYIGQNHAGSVVRGPLKDDWGTLCPTDETVAWRNENCKLVDLCMFLFARALILCLTHLLCPSFACRLFSPGGNLWHYSTQGT